MARQDTGSGKPCRHADTAHKYITFTFVLDSQHIRRHTSMQDQQRRWKVLLHINHHSNRICRSIVRDDAGRGISKACRDADTVEANDGQLEATWLTHDSVKSKISGRQSEFIIHGRVVDVLVDLVRTQPRVSQHDHRRRAAGRRRRRGGRSRLIDTKRYRGRPKLEEPRRIECYWRGDNDDRGRAQPTSAYAVRRQRGTDGHVPLRRDDVKTVRSPSSVVCVGCLDCWLSFVVNVRWSETG